MSAPKDSLRVAPRYHTQETAHIEVFGQMGLLIGQLKNISKTGAFLELKSGEAAPTTGEVLHITIHLFSIGKTHTVHGEVIWKKNNAFGVHFVRKDQLLEKAFSKLRMNS